MLKAAPPSPGRRTRMSYDLGVLNLASGRKKKRTKLYMGVGVVIVIVVVVVAALVVWGPL